MRIVAPIPKRAKMKAKRSKNGSSGLVVGGDLSRKHPELTAGMDFLCLRVYGPLNKLENTSNLATYLISSGITRIDIPV